jgi:hypothetical protein
MTRRQTKVSVTEGWSEHWCISFRVEEIFQGLVEEVGRCWQQGVMYYGKFAFFQTGFKLREVDAGGMTNLRTSSKSSQALP